jgi:hypothetical protein
MDDASGQADVAICGCFYGEDFEVLHQVSGTGVIVRSSDRREWSVGWPEWRAAVFGFADRVSAFYAACTPKEPSSPEDAAAFRKFVAEWQRRRGKPLGRRS